MVVVAQRQRRVAGLLALRDVTVTRALSDRDSSRLLPGPAPVEASDDSATSDASPPISASERKRKEFLKGSEQSHKAPIFRRGHSLSKS